MRIMLFWWTAVILSGCTLQPLPQVPQWTTHEITLTSDSVYANPYVEVDAWAEFRDEDGRLIRRPAFWDGENHWKVRFAPPDSTSVWAWRAFSSDETNVGLHGPKGRLQAVPYRGDNALIRAGLLRMSPGGRSVVRADGSPFPLVADTPWAIPFRATVEQVRTYAQDRRRKGFNAALLMSLQPDMRAEGPNARNTSEGFAVAFRDLRNGTLNDLQSGYFQYLDSIASTLLEHGIVPVWQPVFHGFGWKGLDVLGNVIDPGEYVRYCRYLLARYGSYPALWLIAGDNGGRDPGVKEAGEMLERWDDYAQPAGLHYNPCDDYVASWAIDNPLKHCMHHNNSFQAAEWLDFQWAQTGHGTEHDYFKVAKMYENQPTKAVANGEPTYEGMNGGRNGRGWWQGEDAWGQLMAGGTMGVVYGAASLWQWKITADEPGWTDWAQQPLSWSEALDLPGSEYVGYVAKALEGLDWTDVEKRPEWTDGDQPLLAKEGTVYVSYLRQGGTLRIDPLTPGLPWRWFDPRNGEWTAGGTTGEDSAFTAPSAEPWVLVVGGG